MFAGSAIKRGGTRTTTHLQEKPTAKKKVPARGAGKSAGGIHGCRVTAAGLLDGAWPKGKAQWARRWSREGEEGNIRIVFTPLVKTASVELPNVPAVVVDFKSTV